MFYDSSPVNVNNKKTQPGRRRQSQTEKQYKTKQIWKPFLTSAVFWDYKACQVYYSQVSRQSNYYPDFSKAQKEYLTEGERKMMWM